MWHKTAMTLAEAMRNRGLTDGTLAEQVGVSRVFITRIRNGIRRPSLAVAAKIEEATGVRPAALAENVNAERLG